MTFIGLLTLFVLLDILHFLHKIVFCGIPFGPFITRPHERRPALRLFNVGCEKLLKAGFTQQLLHGGDAEELLFIGVKACALNGCGDCGFAGVLAVGAALDQLPAGERRAADCLLERVFFHIRSPGGKRVNLVQDAGDLLIGQEGRLLLL